MVSGVWDINLAVVSVTEKVRSTADRRRRCGLEAYPFQHIGIIESRITTQVCECRW